MTDYMWAKTENIQKLLDNCLKRQKQELIGEFLDKIRHIPLFWVLENKYLKEVYKEIDTIRDYYQNILKERRK